MSLEDWKTYRRVEVEIKRDLSDDIHDYLTKTFNVYIIQVPPQVFKFLDLVRDKLIPLTARFDHNKYIEFCDAFSRTYRSILVSSDISEDVKKLVKELVAKTNSFFMSKGLQLCVREIRYYGVKVRVLFKGSPLVDAIVVAESEGRAVATAKADEHGFAKIELPEGKYNVYVYKLLDKGSYVYDEKAINVPQDGEVEFTINETKTLSEIERIRSGKPLIKELQSESSEQRSRTE